MQYMKIDFSLNYNVPEEISKGCSIGYFIGILFYIVLTLMVVFYSSDGNWLKDLKELVDIIIASGLFVTLGWAFILIYCPIYFLIGFIYSLYRYKKSRKIFYSTPNIEYVKFNDDNIFFKNTCPNHDITIKKSDVISVSLTGNIVTAPGATGRGTFSSKTVIEKFTMTIKTAQNSFTFYPNVKMKQIIHRKWYEIIENLELYSLQIAFYKKYFNYLDIDIKFNSDISGSIAELQYLVSKHEIED